MVQCSLNDNKKRFCKQLHWKVKFYYSGLFSLGFFSAPFSTVLFYFISQNMSF